MEKLERTLLMLLVLSGVITFGCIALRSLFHGDFDTFAAYALVAGLVWALISYVKKDL